MSFADTDFDPYAAVIDFGEFRDSQRQVRYGFEIGKYRLLLAPSVTSEVCRSPALFPIPHSPSLLLGMINLRGKLVPIFDLHRWLNQGVPAKDAYLLVVDEGNSAAGMFVDGLPVALDADAAEPVADPDEIPAELKVVCRDTAGFGDRCWHTIDHLSMFEKLADRTE